MSLPLIELEINRFLGSNEPEVLCIQGKWGIGKTFAWNSYLRQAKKKGEVGLGQYSYVSLFGQNSLVDVKSSLFENTVSTREIPSTDGAKGEFEKNLDRVSRLLRKGSAWFKSNPIVEGYVGSLDRFLFLNIHEQIICIDDLERAGDGLRLIDVLGLASHLKEEKKCKVVLLLNDQELDEKSKATFQKQLEKVTDTVLTFSPSAEEATELAFADVSNEPPRLREHCVALEITNIRIIKKLERICRRLQESLADTFPDLIPQAIHSAVLFGWSHYKADGAPDIKFIRTFNKLGSNMTGVEKAKVQERVWREKLHVYNFRNLDGFDEVILDGVEAGYPDVEKLLIEAKKVQSSMDQYAHRKSLEDAWDSLHTSFDRNDTEALDAILNSSMENVSALGPRILDDTVCFLKRFGRSADAQKLLSHFMDQRGHEKELFVVSEPIDTPFWKGAVDEEVKSAFRAKTEEYSDDRDPAEVLIQLADSNGWSRNDLELLSNLSEDDFYAIFKGSTGDRLRSLLNGALKYSNVVNATEEMKKISSTAESALKRIASESDLNRERVQFWGISLEEE